uniref:Small G protein signaling modulator 3 n=1 Tax=Rattus norvegicus TaxID=10116 RepID=A0A8I5ZM92_RAT
MPRSMKSCHRPQHMMSGNHTPSASGPFSALTPSIWPQEILAKSSQKEDSSEPEICYDEFGFRVDKEGVLCVVLAALELTELRDLPAPASLVLGLKTFSTTPGFLLCF